MTCTTIFRGGKGEISSEKMSRLKKMCQIAILSYFTNRWQCQNVNCIFLAFTGLAFLSVLLIIPSLKHFDLEIQEVRFKKYPSVQ